MNYLLAAAFAAIGITLLIWNKPVAEKLGAFYSRRFALTFGKLAHTLHWDDPSRPFNRFMYRGFVITGGIIFLIFAVVAFFGTNFVGPSAAQPANSLLQTQN
jgi:hypothetical protein